LGHKVNPNGFRLGVIRGWESRWYANRNYKDLVGEDDKLRKLIRKRLYNAAVSRIEIERVAGTQISVAIHTAKPGIVIGKSGESVERLRQQLETLTKKKVRLSILEIRNPEAEAFLIGRSIAEQIEKRVSFRRAMKQAVQKAMRANAKGIKVIVAGRLGGAEIARVEKEVEGSVPLQTLRANIDYGQTEAHTTFGVIGIKVWVYHGEVLPERQRAEGLNAAEPSATPVQAGGERGERFDRGGPRGGGRGGERGDRGAPRGAGTPRGGDRGPRPAGAGGPGAGAPRAPRPAQAGPSASPRVPRSLTVPRPDDQTAPTAAAEAPSASPVTAAPEGEPATPTAAASEPTTSVSEPTTSNETTTSAAEATQPTPETDAGE
jgi:small subunit ribosomal protein S3